MDLHNPWVFLVIGYLVTVVLETPVLLAGFSRRHSVQTRLLAGAWLTACTYPVVVLVLPPLLRETWGEIPYLLVAETFAPFAECALFVWVFGVSGKWWNLSTVRDCAAIIAANLVSFLTGQFLWYYLAVNTSGEYSRF
jgi:drug/metabolite transporter (DMT)-like permease